MQEFHFSFADGKIEAHWVGLRTAGSLDHTSLSKVRNFFLPRNINILIVH